MTSPRVVLCKASAGSGKTFTLAKSFIRILLERPSEYDRILAVTFTNKATEEMKSRILEFLTEISRIKTAEDFSRSDIAKVLQEELPSWDFRQMAAAAEKALSNILHDYGRFSVMTIDSFFQKIIRSFIQELKLPGAANLSMDSELALDEAVAALLKEYDTSEEKELNKWLRELALGRLDDGQKWQPTESIRALAKQLFNEKVTRLEINYPISEVSPLYQELKAEIEHYKEQIARLSQHALGLIDRHGMRQGVFSRNSIPNQLEKIVDNPKDFALKPTSLAQINGDSNPFPKALEKSAAFPAYQNAWDAEIQSACKAIVDFNQQNEVRKNTAEAILKNLQSLALLSFVSEKMKKYREDNGIVLISDNSQLINKIVNSSDTPFLFEKLGNKYKYILLDEFQDTSSLQWDNFLPLITEILAHRESCKILIVGDAKQSIYRWRNGDLKLILSEVKTALSRHWSDDSEMVLERNFRSRENLVLFNNELFPELARETALHVSSTFGDSGLDDRMRVLLPVLFTPKDTQQIPNKSGGGYVELKFMTKDDKKITEESQDGRSAKEQYLFDLILNLTTQKGYSLSDITFLVRNNSESIKLATLLTDWGYAVLTADALRFNQQPVIQLLLEALRFIQSPEIDLYKTALAHRYARLHKTGIAPLEKSDVAQFYAQYLPDLSQRDFISSLQTMVLTDMIQELIRILNLQVFRGAYTEQFLDLVAQFQSTSKRNGMADFFEWWNLKERSVQMSGEIDGLQIVTIHKAKGLEFKVVIIPELNWKIVETSSQKQPMLWCVAPSEKPFNHFTKYPIPFNAAKNSFFQSDYEEEAMMQAADNLNLAYVAFTRAVDHLYAIAEVAKTDTMSTIGKAIFSMLSRKNPELNESLIYQYGKPHNKTDFQSKEKPSSIIHKEIVLDTPSFRPPELAFAPIWKSLDRRIGEVVHDIAATYRKGADLNKLVERVATKASLQHDVIQSVKARMEYFFSHPKIQDLYSVGEIYAERTIYFEGNLLRFDLLIKTATGYQLYDFKTGTAEKKHKDQLNYYKTALESVGILVEKQALIYIQESGEPVFV